jgi:hypothetical protein
MSEGIKEEIVSKLIDSFPALLTVLGVVLVLLGLAGGVSYNQWFPISELEARVAAVVAGTILLGLGFFSWRTRVIVPKAQSYGIEIDYPKDGDRVDIVDVRGRIKKPLPEKYTLRVLRIYPGSDSFVPMGEARVEIGKSTWVAEQCNIGGRTGDRRSIGVYLVGPDGVVLLNYFDKAVRIHRRVMDQLKDASGKESTEYLPNIERGTTDMIPCARVSVSRR